MIVLTGKTLGERHRELNKMVADVISNKKDFNEIKAEKETTDVDKLFKIDIASLNKDIDYIIEVLKSGDSLYTSQALKCYWIYEDIYSHVINTENLHSNIFPHMSLKMKKKMLTTVAIHIENKDRAATFYAYCKKHKMSEIKFKFLNKTSIEFKMNVMKEEGAEILHRHLDTQKDLENFVENSFELAKCCLEISPWQSQYVCNNLRFLYSVSNDEYLDIMEKYESVDFKNPNKLNRLGLRISKDIIVKHKNRILRKPLLYVNKLNKSMFVKYIAADDAKKCITDLMPLLVKNFWDKNIFGTYKYILDVIPMNEKWKFVKELFTSKYPNEEFEMTKNFYNFVYYDMLSVYERELWALRHIDEEKEIFGSGNDYIWYKFVNTDKALEELRKYIIKTPSSDKRSDILLTLVRSTRDQKDLIKVLNYYYDRHVNEDKYYKIDFINEILTYHNVFDYNTECWEALDKLFHSLEIYTVGKYFGSEKSFMAVSICYHILHKRDIPQALMDFIALDINYSYFNPLLDKLGKEKSDEILQYLIKLFVEKIQPFDKDPHNKKLRDRLRPYVYNITNLVNCFKRNENEIPEIVNRFLNIDSPKCEQNKIITADDIFRLLKTDATLAADTLTHFEKTNELPARLNKVLRKLKTYFPNDIALEYIKFFEKWLPKLSDDYNSHKLINGVVYGIFQLTDINFKKAFMEQYCPLNPKINHSHSGRKLLHVQEAICRFVGYSRPPVPMEYVFKYFKGDYTQYCLPIFNMYSANLPPPELIKFTEATLNSPLSVQKHGLRLAFKCFTVDQLKNLVLTVWKNTKNVSLRMIIYKALFERIIKEEKDAQTELYQALKIITADLHQDDDESVFSLASSNNIPTHLFEDYLLTFWNTVIKLPAKPINIKRQINILSCMQKHIRLVKRVFLLGIIEDHIHIALEEKRLRPHKMPEVNLLYHEKWELTVKYICSYENNEELENSLELLRGIFRRCLDMWSYVYEDTFLYRKFYFNFVNNIKHHRVANRYKSYWHFNVPILQDILELLLKSLPLKEIYLNVWDLQTTIYWRIISSDGDSVSYDRGDDFKYLSPTEISLKYANQIAELVKDRLKKRQFYTLFLQKLANSLHTNVNGTYSGIKDNEMFSIIFCESLVDLSMKETHLLALVMLPTNVSEELRKPVSRVLKKIALFEDEELQSILYSKFVSGDYKNIM